MDSAGTFLGASSVRGKYLTCQPEHQETVFRREKPQKIGFLVIENGRETAAKRLKARDSQIQWKLTISLVRWKRSCHSRLPQAEFTASVSQWKSGDALRNGDSWKHRRADFFRTRAMDLRDSV
jgi:hypothetical protein